MWRVFALDISGSTSFPKYWQISSEIFERFCQAPPEKELFYAWNSADSWIQESNFSKKRSFMNSILKKRNSNGGTYPQHFLKHMKNMLNGISTNEVVELWLITDGEIYETDINLCKEINANIRYSEIKFFLNTTRTSSDNISVLLPLAQNTKSSIDLNGQLLNIVDTTDLVGRIESITLENFYETIQDVSNGCILACKCNESIIAEVVAALDSLKKRLLTEINNSLNIDPFKRNTTTLDLNEHIKSIQEHFNRYVKQHYYSTESSRNLSSDVDKLRSKILSLSNDRSMAASKIFDLKFNNQREIEETEEDAEEEADEDYEMCKFYDPVTLSDESVKLPIILLNKINFFEKLNSNIIAGDNKLSRIILKCPIFCPRNIVMGITGATVSQETYNGLLGFSTYQVTDPLTRNACYPLYLNEKNDNYNDYIVAKCLTNGRKTPNFVMWYYIIWLYYSSIESNSQDSINILRKYSMRRLAEYQYSSIPLFSSNPNIRTVRSDMVDACVYSFYVSTYIFADDYKLYKHEQLRTFCKYPWVVKALKDITHSLTTGDYWENMACEIERRAALLGLASEFHQINLRQRITCISEKLFKKSSMGFLTNEPIENPGFTQMDLFAIVENPGVHIPFRDSIVKKFELLKRYYCTVYELAQNEVLVDSITINLKTLRPKLYLDDDSFYLDNYIKNCYVVYYQMSANNTLIKHKRKVRGQLCRQRVMSLFNLAFDYLHKKEKELDTLKPDDLLPGFVMFVKKSVGFKNMRSTLFPVYIDDAVRQILEKMYNAWLVRETPTFDEMIKCDRSKIEQKEYTQTRHLLDVAFGVNPKN